MIRLVLENGVRWKLDRFFDAQVLGYRLEQIKDVASEQDVYTLESTLREIAKFGVFGAALNSVAEHIAKSDQHPFEPDLSEGAEIDLTSKFVQERSADLLSFFHDRLKVYLKDEGLRHDVIDACLSMPGNDDLTLLVKRAARFGAFLKTDDGENLLQGYKRANNILTQAEAKDGVEYSFGADVKFAESDEENALFAALDQAEAAITPAMQSEDFEAAMGAMAALRAPIDAFFEGVQVNSDNDVVRRNRLNLLSRIRQICGGVADLTRVEG